jgi:carbon storage regulator CsrA
MLIIGREIGQSVIIGDVIKVTILQIGSNLRLAIDAPMHIRISRVKQNPEDTLKLSNRARIIGDTLLIEDDIKVSMLQTESGLLRFAIDAPKEVGIFREELFKTICLSDQ